MRITDFTLPADKAARLADIDELVEQGISRTTAEAIIARLDKVLMTDFKAFLDESSEGHPTLAIKHFVMASVIAYVYDWAADRMPMASVASTIALEVLKREG